MLFLEIGEAGAPGAKGSGPGGAAEGAAPRSRRRAPRNARERDSDLGVEGDVRAGEGAGARPALSHRASAALREAAERHGRVAYDVDRYVYWVVRSAASSAALGGGGAGPGSCVVTRRDICAATDLLRTRPEILAHGEGPLPFEFGRRTAPEPGPGGQCT